MYLWNYLSREIAENGRPEVASIGYYDSGNNVILFTVNESKWSVAVPEGMTDRDAMILYMVVTVPIIKDFLDEADKARLLNPVVNEIMPATPETVAASAPAEAPAQEEAAVEEPVEEAPVQEEPVQSIEAFNEEEDGVYITLQDPVDEDEIFGEEEKEEAQAEPAYVPAAEPVQAEPAYVPAAEAVQAEPAYEPAAEPVQAAPVYAPVAEPDYTPAPEQTPVQQEPAQLNNYQIVRCENCNLFYDSGNYSYCPFCKSEAETVIQIEDTDADVSENDAEEKVATVRFMFNGQLHSFAKVADGDTITLGRADNCDICIPEEKQLSRIHCSFQYSDREKAFYVTDLSLNGVYDPSGTALPKNTPVMIPDNGMLWIATKAMSVELDAAGNSIAPAVYQEVEEPVAPAAPTKRICSNCSGEYNPDSTFCPWCGTRVAQ